MADSGSDIWYIVDHYLNLISKVMLRFGYCLLVVFLLLSNVQVKAQFDSKKYDKESFLVGTLDEYNGYQRKTRV